MSVRHRAQNSITGENYDQVHTVYNVPGPIDGVRIQVLAPPEDHYSIQVMGGPAPNGVRDYQVYASANTFINGWRNLTAEIVEVIRSDGAPDTGGDPPPAPGARPRPAPSPLGLQPRPAPIAPPPAMRPDQPAGLPAPRRIHPPAPIVPYTPPAIPVYPQPVRRNPPAPTFPQPRPLPPAPIAPPVRPAPGAPPITAPNRLLPGAPAIVPAPGGAPITAPAPTPMRSPQTQPGTPPAGPGTNQPNPNNNNAQCRFLPDYTSWNKLDGIRELIEELLRRQNEEDGHDCCDEILYSISEVKDLLKTELSFEIESVGSDCETRTYASSEEGLRGLNLQVTELAKMIDDLKRKICDDPAIAAVPEWWQVRLGADRSQVVIQFGELQTNGKIGKPKYPLTIPHVDPSLIGTYSPISPYTKGQWEGILTLSDNSKLIVNAVSANEAERVINQAKSIILPAALMGSFQKIGQRKGQALSTLAVAAKMAKYFPTGQQDTKPQWVRYFTDE